VADVSERCLRCGGEMSTGHKCPQRVDPPFPINARIPVGAHWVTVTFSDTAINDAEERSLATILELRAELASAKSHIEDLIDMIKTQNFELIEKQQYILRLERGR